MQEITKRDLENYRAAKRELGVINDQINALVRVRRRHDIVIGSSRYKPYGERLYVVNGVPMSDPELRKYRFQYASKRNKVLEQLQMIEAWLETLTDAELRTIITLRYIQGLKWEWVAANVSPLATADSVRMAVNRHFDP